MWEQRDEQLDHLPGHILLDLARNESASRAWRKAAVVIMLKKNFPQSAHPDLATLAAEIRAEEDAVREVEGVVEGAIEGELPEFATPSAFQLHATSSSVAMPSGGGVFAASVTTASLQGVEVVQNMDETNGE